MTDRQNPPVRILCFGDPFTPILAPLLVFFFFFLRLVWLAPPKSENYPYAEYLEKQLSKAEALQHLDLTVFHMGYPGWTADNLLKQANVSVCGFGPLSQLLQKSDPTPSLDILLVGTNDLGELRSASKISESIVGLHQLCLNHGIPNNIAVTGVTSNPCRKSQQSQRCCKRILRVGAKSKLFPLSFEYQNGDEKWSLDGLHLSQKGYQVLGESLVPVVEQILCDSRTGSK